MTQVKKAFQPIVDVLENALNNDSKAKVKDVIDQIIELAKAKVVGSGGLTYLKNTAGETVAIHDYYFKRWMPVVGDKAVEFGKKEKTGSGYNTMSKEGQNLWNKQLREAKNAEVQLLQDVAAGHVAPGDIVAKQAEIAQARASIAPTELGFASKDEVLAYLSSMNVEVDAAAAAEAND